MAEEQPKEKERESPEKPAENEEKQSTEEKEESTKPPRELNQEEKEKVKQHDEMSDGNIKTAAAAAIAAAAVKAKVNTLVNKFLMAHKKLTQFVTNLTTDPRINDSFRCFTT